MKGARRGRLPVEDEVADPSRHDEQCLGTTAMLGVGEVRGGRVDREAQEGLVTNGEQLEPEGAHKANTPL